MSRQIPASVRSKVIERDGGECRFCGMTSDEHKEENGKDLHAHHIIPQRSNGPHTTQNLITVCRDCHTTLEHTQANAVEILRDEYESEDQPPDDVQSRENAAYRAGWREHDLADEPVKMFAWLENRSIEVTMVQAGLVNPKIGMYRDREEAADEFLDYDGPVEIKTYKFNIADEFKESFRYSSEANLEVYTNGMDRSEDFSEVGEPDEESFFRSDIPEELSADE